MSWTIDRHTEHDHVVVVTMTTNSVNAQNPSFFEDLHDCFDRLESDYPDCAVVLTGNGGTFSAGLDFEYTFPLLASKDDDVIEDWYDKFRPTNLRIFTYPRPTVAAINGHAIAGGLLTAISCDYRIAVDDEHVQFGLNEVAIGIPFPASFVPIIQYALGTNSATPATLFGELFTPDEAVQVGYIHEVVPQAEVLDRAVTKAASIQPDCYDAYAFTKEAFQAQTVDTIDRINRRQDQNDLSAAMASDGGIRAQARVYKEIRGEDPHWAG